MSVTAVSEDFVDTGLGWLPTMPKHWRLEKAKWLFAQVSEKNHPEEQLLSATQEYGVYPRDLLEGRVTMPMGELNGFKLVKEGDFVISLRSFQGGIEYSRFQGLVSPAYVVLRKRQPIVDGYYRHLLKSFQFIDELNTAVSGIREGKNIVYEDFAELVLPVPPRPEQDAIVAYLDGKLESIDRYLRVKEREIALLEERKRALIHRAVTRGLDPNPQLQPSGIPWLPEIPVGWELLALKRVVRVQGGYAFPAASFGDTGIPVIRMNNLKRGNLDLSESVRVPVSLDIDRYRLREGDLLYGLSGSIGDTGSLGNFAFVGKGDLPCLLNQRVARFIPTSDRITNKFVSLLIQLPEFYAQILAETTGTAQFNVSTNDVGSAVVPLPPPDQQAAIYDYCEEATAELTTTITRARHQIERMQEYRTALIAEAVTGKIAVTTTN